MNFLLFDQEVLIGCVPDVDAVKRMSKIHTEDTNRKPRVYVNIDGELKEWGGE